MADFKWAIQNGDLDSVRQFVEKDAGAVNASIDGRPPLVFAADYGQVKIAEFLISKGGQLNAADKHGITPLLAAVFEGHTQCVKILLDAGCDTNGKTPDGRTYLEAAEKNEIKALLSS